MKEPARYPTTIWNGLSDNPNRTSLNDDIPPDTRDWDRLVAEVIATQTQLTSVDGTTANAMHWKGTWNVSTAYVVGDMVYNSSDFIFYVAIADDTGNTPGDPGSVLIWEAASMPITGLPQITGVLFPTTGNYVLTSDGESATWGNITDALAAQTPSVGRDQFITVNTQNGTVGSGNYYHGTPVALARQEGVKVTGNIEAGGWLDSIIEGEGAVAGDDWNEWVFTVVEEEGGDLTVTFNASNNTYTANVSNTVNTAVADVVAAWGAAQSDITFTYEGSADYDPSAQAPADLTLTMGTDGVDEAITAIAATTNGANLVIATTVGLCYNPLSEDALGAEDPVVIQTDGIMTFTANQIVNTFNGGVHSTGNLLTPGIPHYVGADDLICGLGATSNASYVVPVGTPISTTEFKLMIGLPTVGLDLPGA